MWNSDITQPRPRHCCANFGTPNGHCASRTDAVNTCKDALMLPLKRRLRIPAQVKWTSVSAVACIITFMLCIHCVIAAAELRMVNRQLPADSIRHHESDSDDGQAPEDCKKREQRRRARRMRESCADNMTRNSLLLCVTSGVPVMKLHYWLFRTSSLHGADEDGITGFMCCCLRHCSKPLKLFKDLGQAIHPERPGIIGSGLSWSRFWVR